MDSFHIIAIICAGCGAIMVCGGLFLLYKGILKFPKTGKGEALTLEVKNAMKEFKIATTTPAIAFFLVGLLFVIIPLIITDPRKNPDIQFIGRILDAEERAAVLVRANSWRLPEADDFGKISGTVSPNLKDFIVEISAPGKIFTVNKNDSDIKDGVISLGEIRLKSVADRNEIQKTILALPSGVVETPLSSGGSYGGSK